MWAIIPVKALAHSKKRLANVLSEEQRERLAEVMLKDVLAAIAQTQSIAQTLVVTNDEKIAQIAEDYHARVLMESEDCCGLNQAVELGAHYAQLHGATRALILHGDIPLLQSKDLELLVRNHLAGSLSIVPDKHEQGTNGLLIDLPAAIDFQYGKDSYHKHVQSSKDKGVLCSMMELSDLALDVDEPEDLQQLFCEIADHQQLATAQYLMRPDMQEAIRSISTGS